MPNYQLGKIYQIVCLTTGEKYIGSTTQATLALRLGGHCRGYKQWKSGKVNLITSYPIIERGNYQIELLEAYPCNSKDELNAREGHYIRTVECVNKIILGRTPQEHYRENREVFLEKRKAYVETHKEEIVEKQKVYVEAHKTELSEYYKAYYHANREVLLEKAKEYAETNKHKIAETKKKYNDENQDKLKEKRNIYVDKNRVKISERRKAQYKAKKLQRDAVLP